MNAQVMEANRAATRRIYDEVVNGAKHDLIPEFFSSDWNDHERARGNHNVDANGLDGVTRVFTTLRGAFPDHHIDVHDLIAEGDVVVARITSHGTHRGEFLGVAPTGLRVSYAGIDIFRFADGKVIEHWGATNMLDFLTQVGAWAPGK